MNPIRAAIREMKREHLAVSRNWSLSNTLVWGYAAMQLCRRMPYIVISYHALFIYKQAMTHNGSERDLPGCKTHPRFLRRADTIL